MMGERLVVQDSLFYEFRLEEHVPASHLVRSIDRFVDLTCCGYRKLHPAGDNAQISESCDHFCTCWEWWNCCCIGWRR